MRLFAIIFFSALTCVDAFGQFRAGIKVSPGLGYTKSSDLKSYFRQLSEDGAVFSQSYRPRAHVAFGVFADYKINEQWYTIIEPVFTLASAHLVSSFTADNVDENGNGSLYQVTSDARFITNYISVPLSARYRFNARRELYVTGGLVFNARFKPTMISNEQSSMVHYKDGVGGSYMFDKNSERLKMDIYNVFSLNLMIGAGKMFNRYGRNVFVDIRYSHPLTKSALRATSDGDHLLLNSVYTRGSDKVFTDFKTGLFSFNISVALYKNYR